MTGEPPDDRIVAAVLRAALALGIATPADLVPWADEQVMARDRPPARVLDLSVGAAVPADRAVADLHGVAYGAERSVVARLVLGLIDLGDDPTFG